MVFPSSRCLTCKKRRVKCDFAQPSCGQCHKASRVCIWGPYSEPGLHFRSENAFAQGKPRRPRKLRNGTDNNSRNLIRFSVLSRTLSLPVEHYALHYWIKTFTKWPDDLLDISLEYGAYAIYNWDSLRPDSSLYSAVMSFSLAMFGQVQQSSEIVESSRKYYSQSCTHIRRDIQDLSDKTIDQLLMATMLLDTYDNVIPREWVRSPSNPSQYVGKKAGHHRGTAALLLARKQRGYHPHTPLDVALRRPVIRAYIVGGVAVDKWLEDDELHNSEDPKLKLDMLMISVTSLRSRFKSLSRDFSYGITTNATIVNNLLIEAGSLDAALAAWSHNLSGPWNFAAHTTNRLNQPELDRFCYNGRNDSYTTHGHAVMWNRYRAIRVIVNSIRAQLLSSGQYFCDPFLDVQLGICCETIKYLTADICYSVGFFLSPYYLYRDKHERDITERGTTAFSEIDPGIMSKMATILAWPLAVVVHTEMVPLAQKKWLRNVLATISGIIGTAILESFEEILDFGF